MLPPAERYFNFLHSSTRITVEHTFGKLKNRFRILKKPLSQKETSTMDTMTKKRSALHITRLHELFVHVWFCIISILTSLTIKSQIQNATLMHLATTIKYRMQQVRQQKRVERPLRNICGPRRHIEIVYLVNDQYSSET